MHSSLYLVLKGEIMIVVKRSSNRILLGKFEVKGSSSSQHNLMGTPAAKFEQRTLVGQIASLAVALEVLPVNVSITINSEKGNYSTAGEIEVADPSLIKIVEDAVFQLSFMARIFSEKYPESDFHLNYRQQVLPKA